ncbi:MAG: ABC transporter ATP-binding protein [Lachnospiraceae bacterium]
MILTYDLSEENKWLLGLAEGEEVYYVLPLDIDMQGHFRRNSYFVMTNRRILRLEEGTLTGVYPLEEYDSVKSEPQIACGFVYVEKDGVQTIVGRYSAKHLTRFSYMSRGMQILKSGRTEHVISNEYEHSCPKCGRGLPGIKECPHCSGKKKGTIATFLGLLRGHVPMMLMIVFFMLLATGITILNPVVQKHLVDDVLLAQTRSVKAAVLLLAAMFVLTMGIALVNALKSYYCSKMGAYITEDLRGTLFRKIQSLSLSFILDRSPGELMNRVMMDTNRVKMFFESVFCNLFTIVILFVFVTVYMFILNWKMALIAFAFTPLSLFLSMSLRGNFRKRYRLQGTKSDNMNNRLQDVISGMSVVKSYGQEKKESERFNETTEEFARVQRSNEVFFAVFFPALSFLMGIGIYFVTFIGGRSVLLGDMTPGELIQFVNYTGLLYQYINWMSNMPRALMNLLTSLERIGDVMEQEPTIVDGEDCICHEIEGEITFRHASFGYQSYQPVVEDVNLTVKKGEMIGLVGASGTGKSTLINLLMHLYEVDDGQILVDGIDMKKIKLADYHNQLGVVLQENILFAGSIYQNIAYARPDASIEDVIRVAKMANAHEFITKLPDGYQTYVGEHGGNLSGGEKQRIAIARAMLGNPRLLILDEATASLDTESEYLIQRALGRLTKGRTTFAIAHRLSTLKDADRLVVIDGHHIAEVGSHEELMEKKGIYYHLVQAQMSGNMGLRSEMPDMPPGPHGHQGPPGPPPGMSGAAGR